MNKRSIVLIITRRVRQLLGRDLQPYEYGRITNILTLYGISALHHVLKMFEGKTITGKFTINYLQLLTKDTYMCDEFFLQSIEDTVIELEEHQERVQQLIKGGNFGKRIE